jgi:hypothetical protein
MDSLVNDREANLVFKLQAVDTELVPKASLIGTFQHPGPESAVDLQRRLKNSLSDNSLSIDPLFSVSSASSVVTLLRKQSVDQT